MFKWIWIKAERTGKWIPTSRLWPPSTISFLSCQERGEDQTVNKREGSMRLCRFMQVSGVFLGNVQIRNISFSKAFQITNINPCHCPVLKRTLQMRWRSKGHTHDSIYILPHSYAEKKWSVGKARTNKLW